jgi:hypothetical protein
MLGLVVSNEEHVLRTGNNRSWKKLRSAELRSLYSCNARFKVLSAVLKVQVFCHVAPCRLLNICRRFGRA